MGDRRRSVEGMAVTSALPDPEFWRGKRVLLTGHTGFKGAWLSLWLAQLGADVIGVSLPPISTPNLFTLAGIESLVASHFCDIRELESTTAAVRRADPEIVFHLAAQPLVRESYREPVATFATNIMGTAHVLEAIRSSASTRVVVVITTDKVYRNREHQYPYRETDELGGHDPYSASKAASETVVASYRDAFLRVQGIALSSVRAGNVIGGGDWSADRLIPDAVRAWASRQVLEVRRPAAIRPWQHVLEPLSAYLHLAELSWKQPELAGAYNIGPETQEAATVRAVIELARTEFGEGQVAWGDGRDGVHEAGWLSLEIAKARTELGVTPRWHLGRAVERTMHWYRDLGHGADAAGLCRADIAAYEATPA